MTIRASNAVRGYSLPCCAPVIHFQPCPWRCAYAKRIRRSSLHIRELILKRLVDTANPCLPFCPLTRSEKLRSVNKVDPGLLSRHTSGESLSITSNGYSHDPRAQQLFCLRLGIRLLVCHLWLQGNIGSLSMCMEAKLLMLISQARIFLGKNAVSREIAGHLFQASSDKTKLDLLYRVW